MVKGNLHKWSSVNRALSFDETFSFSGLMHACDLGVLHALCYDLVHDWYFLYCVQRCGMGRNYNTYVHGKVWEVFCHYLSAFISLLDLP